VITEVDIENLIRAKAAFMQVAGSCLECRAPFDDVAKVIISRWIRPLYRYREGEMD
jgi:hypothetical protein